MEVKDVQILVLDDTEYLNLTSFIKEKTNQSADDFAFAAMMGNHPLMVLRGEKIEKYPPYVHKAVVAHELAHLHGIVDEEEADRWALKYLDEEESKQFIIDNWLERHGKEYEEICL